MLALYFAILFSTLSTAYLSSTTTPFNCWHFSFDTFILIRCSAAWLFAAVAVLVSIWCHLSIIHHFIWQTIHHFTCVIQKLLQLVRMKLCFFHFTDMIEILFSKLILFLDFQHINCSWVHPLPFYVICHDSCWMSLYWHCWILISTLVFVPSSSNAFSLYPSCLKLDRTALQR